LRLCCCGRVIGCSLLSGGGSLLRALDLSIALCSFGRPKCLNASMASSQHPPTAIETPVVTRMDHRIAARAEKARICVHILGQLGLAAVTGKWPPPLSAGNTMRGVDFYPRKDFIRALIRGALRFNEGQGYVPSLVSPTSFNEHIFARKFFAPLPMPSLADKLAAKDHVKARLGEEFLPSVVWVGDGVQELVAAKLPAGRYVLKANHACGTNLFLNLPGDLAAKRDEIERRTTEWINSKFGYNFGEWQYCTFKPKLFLEEFIDFNGVQTPDDYKFFCFHGKAWVIEVDVDRFTQLRSGFYTPDWKHIPVAYRHAPIQRARPQNLDEMIQVAEAIANGMEFARVDLYTDGKSKLRFGEITFTPGDGYWRFSDFKFDLYLGTLFGKGPHEPFQT
jgi:hypothetical protein